MNQHDWRLAAAQKALTQILPGFEQSLQKKIVDTPLQWDRFKTRINQEWERLFIYLHELYGWQFDFYHTLEKTMEILIRYWFDRPPVLHRLDEKREADPLWYTSEKMIGIVLYVDLFSDNLAGLHDHIPYFEKLGVTYLHLMPLFSTPHGENDGGYAVSDYRSVNPDLGTMEELFRLAQALREHGISLVLDFVFNHTSDEHEWASKAKAGDPEYKEYFFTFTDRALVDRFQEHLRDIFPTIRKGSFTWNDQMQCWVWTTFNNYQWDLNYSNPSVFLAMAEEMLFLANEGVEVLRLDAVAFIWKRIGTSCENQSEAHTIIRAFNAMAGIVAPSLLFVSEAIVHPDEVIQYIHRDECQLSYNPLQMALIWEALATREVKLLAFSMKHRERLPDECTWVNYLRCHDDIGWTFDDEDARQMGIDPKGHRQFLNDFYTGQYPGSFARGVPFQYHPETGDLRISGTLSSLAGLEQALEKQDHILIELAVKRINMLRSILVSIGGIPLLYAGDEYGHLNDYTFLTDPAKVTDSRWVHRSKKRWHAADDLTRKDTLEWRFFHEMVKLCQLRKKLPCLKNGGMEVFDTGNPHIFGYSRANKGQKLLIINNFSEHDQVMSAVRLKDMGMRSDGYDVCTQKELPAGENVILRGYEYIWINIADSRI